MGEINNEANLSSCVFPRCGQRNNTLAPLSSEPFDFTSFCFILLHFALYCFICFILLHFALLCIALFFLIIIEFWCTTL